MMSIHDRIAVSGQQMVVRSIARDGSFFVAEDRQKRVVVVRSQLCQEGLAGRWNLGKSPVEVRVLGNDFLDEVRRLIDLHRGKKMETKAPKGFVRVNSKCKNCKQIDHFDVPEEGLKARRKGVPLSKAFPNLPVERLVQLSRHICPPCQAKAEAAKEPK
jgi:hypothetical protein